MVVCDVAGVQAVENMAGRNPGALSHLWEVVVLFSLFLF